MGTGSEIAGRSSRRRRLLGISTMLLLAGCPAFFVAGLGAADESPLGWTWVDYGDLVDGRRLTHSAETVGQQLRGLSGRPYPASGGRSGDALRHQLLEPHLEPYAFVLSDALDSLAPFPEAARVEVGWLWGPGEAQPAWAELLRARRFVVESDGNGKMRACLPWRSGSGAAPAETSPSEAASEAFERAWPVLRHVFAAERRRLAQRRGTRPEQVAIELEVYAFEHQLERTRFLLGLEPFRTEVRDTRSRGRRPPLDFEGLQSFLDRGLLLEGGRLDPDGRLRLFGSETENIPTIVGRPVDVSDLAVAYRAVFRGGLAEPFMSLERADASHQAIVGYGGRLRDTSLGLVSLLCDIRFKTFSQGIDLAEDEDVRERVRSAVSGFRTHLERLAADPRSREVSAQQTRLWFYPDEVDLTLSEQGDVLVMRRARMSASSERVQEPGGVAREEPPWTLETVREIDRDYDALAGFFPELADLDQVARLLSLFAWLWQAEAEGLPVPDLDALLAVELPELPTPRTFPRLLALNALEDADRAGRVEVVSRVDVVEALDRLLLPAGRPAAPRRRLERARAALDETIADHARLAAEIDRIDLAALDDSALDSLAFRAERLRMHHLVLRTLSPESRERVAALGPGTRKFSVGIGGLDLSMKGSIEKASRRRGRLPWVDAGTMPASVDASARPRARSASSQSPRDEWRPGRSALPETTLPEHGPDGPGAPIRIESGSATRGGNPVTWIRAITGVDGPEPSSRRVVLDASRRVVVFERFEEGRLFAYRFENEGGALRARPAGSGLAPEASPGIATTEPPAELAILRVETETGQAAAALETPTVLLRLQRSGSAEMAAEFPRAVLKRLMLGRDVDLTAGQPLPGLGSPRDLLPASRALMVMLGPDEGRPPWVADRRSRVGEEDPVGIATALRDWWGPDDAPSIVVGSGGRAVARWQSAPRARGDALLLLPDDAFPGLAAARREKLIAAWSPGKIASSLPPDGDLPALVILASGEAPSKLGARLRRLSRDPSLSGRLLGVFSLSGPVRPDLPPSLLEGGEIAALGVAVDPQAGANRGIDGFAVLSSALASAPADGRPVEDLPGPFLWFY